MLLTPSTRLVRSGEPRWKEKGTFSSFKNVIKNENVPFSFFCRLGRTSSRRVVALSLEVAHECESDAVVPSDEWRRPGSDGHSRDASGLGPSPGREVDRAGVEVRNLNGARSAARRMGRRYGEQRGWLDER